MDDTNHVDNAESAKVLDTKLCRADIPEMSDVELPDTIKVEDLTEETTDVLKAFGVNAAGLLNRYSCAIEDAFLEQADKAQKYADGLIEIDIAKKELQLENALLKRRLRNIRDLLSRKQVDDIQTLMNDPL